LPERYLQKGEILDDLVDLFVQRHEAVGKPLAGFQSREDLLKHGGWFTFDEEQKKFRTCVAKEITVDAGFADEGTVLEPFCGTARGEVQVQGRTLALALWEEFQALGAPLPAELDGEWAREGVERLAAEATAEEEVGEGSVSSLAGGGRRGAKRKTANTEAEKAGFISDSLRRRLTKKAPAALAST
jgi:hypothetical protein